MEIRRLRLAMTALVVFVVSGFSSVNEPRYLLWGRAARADVVEAKLGRDPGSRRGRNVMLATLSYREEGGEHRTTTDILPPDWEITAGDEVAVQYIPGDPYTARVVGNRSLLPVAVFGGSLLAVGALRPTSRTRRNAVRPRRRGRSGDERIPRRSDVQVLESP
ncbi:hypothetical protein [Paludisphaera sp.]|uniref:hypothetical protein n=1 Tax=Paludisphaera sp. TaxID=2017432 RepID=UPI00301BDFCD